MVVLIHWISIITKGIDSELSSVAFTIANGGITAGLKVSVFLTSAPMRSGGFVNKYVGDAVIPGSGARAILITAAGSQLVVTERTTIAQPAREENAPSAPTAANANVLL